MLLILQVHLQGLEREVEIHTFVVDTEGTPADSDKHLFMACQ